MNKTIKIPGHGYSGWGQPSIPLPSDSIFLCGDTLAGIWDDEFPAGIRFTVCLRKRVGWRRPYKEAIKLNIPPGFEHSGVEHELISGRMSNQKILVVQADNVINNLGLQGEYWAWIEMDD